MSITQNNTHELFRGYVGRTYKDSTPWWPEPETPDEDSPNVLVILFDDMGFGSLGCFGSEIDTSNIDALAQGGLRYNNFHTTALCSPTRASLLTGRDHHAVGMSIIANADSGFPSKRGAIRPNAGTLAEMLASHGYNSYAVGKWHLAPVDQTSAVGPFDQWPLGRGFSKYYGFLEALSDQFRPALVRDNQHVSPPCTPEEGYTLNADLVDNACQFLTDHVSLAPKKPFFMYFAPGAMHSPHQAPQEFLDKYKGRFDEGWDKIREQRLARQIEMGIVPEGTGLVPRNDGVEAWDSLSDDQKRLYCKFEEAYAAFLDHTDKEIGRLLAHLEKLGKKDNTMIFLLSDNGASQEGQTHGSTSTTFYENMDAENFDFNLERIDNIGTMRAKNNYPIGWAQVENTPLRRYKQNTHAGGVQDPMIVSWPRGIGEKGGVRNQFHHVMDIVPTILEAIGTEAPSMIRGVPQMNIHGTSMLYSFNDKDQPTHKRTQVFEMFGHRAIWHDGWKAVAYHKRYSDYDDDQWELYNVAEDFAEQHDLADKEPERLRKMIEMWWAEAGRYDILPLDDRGFAERRAMARPRTDSPRIQQEYVFYPGMSPIPGGAAPFIMDRSYQIQARVRIPQGSEGVILACGGLCGGYSLYVQDGKIVHDYNFYEEMFRAAAPVPEGGDWIDVLYRFEKTGICEGIGHLSLNGQEVSTVSIPKTYRYFMEWEGLSLGKDDGSPVSPAYADRGGFAFEGEIDHVRITLGNDIAGPHDYESQD
ncbi:arylsulfatase [Paracoccus seriniphilus]|uniref:Arylsulfatase n=1 Tax=Paracoccus seriniphilus TaxID=184748 RepID=A0A239PVF3_9RHOB|nr:arylsulfatase [Paracoccus seriniphilus]WCR16493.1 arylsulfatase [Paracoccus seriniphilus]SNT73667.1 arylsulfatase [Paracoccus seriniphilus]